INSTSYCFRNSFRVFSTPALRPSSSKRPIACLLPLRRRLSGTPASDAKRKEGASLVDKLDEVGRLQVASGEDDPTWLRRISREVVDLDGPFRIAGNTWSIHYWDGLLIFDDSDWRDKCIC